MSGSKKELIGLDRMVAAALFIESSGFNSESKIGTSEVTSGFALTYGESSRAVKLLISKSGSFYTQGADSVLILYTTRVFGEIRTKTMSMNSKCYRFLWINRVRRICPRDQL